MIQANTSYFDQVAATWHDNPSRIALMKAVGEAILREVQPTTEMRVLDHGCIRWPTPRMKRSSNGFVMALHGCRPLSERRR